MGLQEHREAKGETRTIEIGKTVRRRRTGCLDIHEDDPLDEAQFTIGVKQASHAGAKSPAKYATTAGTAAKSSDSDLALDMAMPSDESRLFGAADSKADRADAEAFEKTTEVLFIQISLMKFDLLHLVSLSLVLQNQDGLGFTVAL